MIIQEHLTKLVDCSRANSLAIVYVQFCLTEDFGIYWLYLSHYHIHYELVIGMGDTNFKKGCIKAEFLTRASKTFEPLQIFAKFLALQ